MGIVVLIFMVLGLLHQSPIKWLNLGGFGQKPAVVSFIGIGLLLMGLWNAVWFGLRHLTMFWGLASVVSGIFMVVTAFIILADSNSQFSTNLIVKKTAALISPLLTFWLLGLAGSALLYGVTIVQLNLGLPIIN